MLRISCAAQPPQLRNEGDWTRPSHTLVAFDHLYPARDFPVAGHWHLQPPESSSVPPALHLHLWHHISGVSIYVLERRMAHHGTGDVLYWFHSRSRLAENTQWPRFVRQRPMLCYVVDLPRAEAARELAHCHRGLSCDTGRVHTAFSPGTPAEAPRLRRHVSDNGGTCGVSTSKLVDMQLHSHYTDLRLRMSSVTTICPAICALAADARFAFACMLEVQRAA